LEIPEGGGLDKKFFVYVKEHADFDKPCSLFFVSDEYLY
jgi:hypothetical protein